MRFCKGCGKTLSILQSNGEYCARCRPVAKTTETPPAKDSISPESVDAFLRVENGRIILESPEGWLLWSGDSGQTHELVNIMERATRISKIRKRKKKVILQHPPLPFLFCTRTICHSYRK